MSEKEKTNSYPVNFDSIKSQAEIMRGDGWNNVLTNLGSSKDRRTMTTFGTGYKIPKHVLSQMYRFGGLSKKVVKLPAEEATRRWIRVENDVDNQALDEFKRLNAKQIMTDALKWSRLFGGALVVLGIDDGGTLEDPLRMDNIRSFDFMRVYDRHQIHWMVGDVSNDPESKYYGEPEKYRVQSYRTATSFTVHRDRCLIFDGEDLPEFDRVGNDGWGDSVLYCLYEELKDYGLIKASAGNIVQDFIQTILNIENLADLIASGHDDIVKKRLDIIDQSRSVGNTIMLDGEEKFTKTASSVTGLPELMGQFALSLSAVSGIPITKLFGQAPAGLNATGESDIRNYYDMIETIQMDCLHQNLERLLELIMLAKNGLFKGVPNEDANIVFNPLWQKSDKEDAEWKHSIAKTDEIYIKNGVLTPDEVAVSRFDGGFSPDTEIDVNDRDMEELEQEPDAQPEK